MNCQPIVHIIIPVYNCEQFLSQCLTSCFCQSYKNIDVYAVRGKSSDASNDILIQFAANHPNLFILDETARGPGPARNVGLMACPPSGFVAFVDADDQIESKYIEVLVQAALEEDAEIVLFSEGPCQISDRSDATFCLIKENVNLGPYRKLIKTSLAKKISFKDSFREDVLYNVEAFSLCKRFAVRNLLSEENQNCSYVIGDNPHSIMRSPCTQRRLLGYGLGWLEVYRFLESQGFYGNHLLEQECVNVLAAEFLEIYGNYLIRSSNEGYSAYLSFADYVNSRRIIRRSKPAHAFARFKRLLFLYLRPLYRPSNRLFNRFKH